MLLQGPDSGVAAGHQPTRLHFTDSCMTGMRTFELYNPPVHGLSLDYDSGTGRRGKDRWWGTAEVRNETSVKRKNREKKKNE